MKKIIFTQRVEIIESYGERRDCADQNISKFLDVCGFLPVPIMNNPLLAKRFCEEIKVDGVLLTGGNDLCDYGGNAPERDETEKKLLEYAIEHEIPLLGICRGMQMIANYFGTNLRKVDGHIRVNHRITGEITRNGVNSFHGMGIKELSSSLRELARTDDGVIEAIQHKRHRIAGIMWHPERVDGFDNADIDLVSDYLNGGVFV